jgi:hypothetical protein
MLQANVFLLSYNEKYTTTIYIYEELWNITPLVNQSEILGRERLPSFKAILSFFYV